MNRVTLLYPKVKVTLNGSEAAPTEVILMQGVNRYPSAKVVTQQRTSKGQDVSDVGQKELLAELGKIQKSMFDRRSPDSEVDISIEPGQGGSPMGGNQTIKFKGLSTKTAMYYSKYGASRDDAIVPEYAEMDTLNLSIYDPADLFADGNDAALFSKFNGKVLPYLRTAFNCIMDPERLQSEVKSDANIPIPKEIVNYRQQQHALNELVKHHYLTLLSNSSKTFNWEDLPEYLRWTNSEGQGYGREIPTLIAAAYTGQGTSWLSTIVSIADQFHCFYRPHWDNVGELVCWDKVKENPEEITLFPVDIFVTAGVEGIFSPKYLIISDGMTLQGASNNLHLDSACQPYVRAYPPEQVKEGASGYKIALPTWWPRDGITASQIMGGIEIADDPSVADLPEDVPTKTAKTIKKNYENRDKIVDMWAKCAYQRYALSGCSAKLTLPPTLNLQAGQYYVVKDPQKEDGGGGNVMFEGLLASVEHHIKVEENVGQSYTVAEFTRVRFPGFKLPGE